METSIAVVIPTKNVELYLKRCIESVLNQILLPQEIIIVDNGSTDQTLRIAEQFRKKHPNLVVISHCNIPGAGPTRQKGINIASSSYITLLDADDYYHPYTLHFLFQAVQNTGAACGKMVYFSPFSKDAHVQKIRNTIITGKTLKKGNSIGLSSTIFKKSLLKKINGFNPQIKYAEDYDLHLRVTRSVSFIQSQNALVFYQLSPIDTRIKKKRQYIYWEGYVCAKNGFFGWNSFLNCLKVTFQHLLFSPARLIKNKVKRSNKSWIQLDLLVLPLSYLKGFFCGLKGRRKII